VTDIIREDDQEPFFSLAEFIGPSCEAPTLTARVNRHQYNYGPDESKAHRSVDGCIHFSDGRGMATYTFGPETQAELVEALAELEHFQDFIQRVKEAICDAASGFIPDEPAK
jgi:hypothetical protein